MTKNEAINILHRIDMDPGIADQFTEEEITELERLAHECKSNK